MQISKAAIGWLAALCITVGARSAYLALRSNEPSQPAAGTEMPIVSPGPSTSVAEQAEAIINSETARPVDRAPSPPSAVSSEPEARVANEPLESTPGSDRLPLPAVSLETQGVAPPVLESVGWSGPGPIRAQEPASPEFEELVVPADSVVGLQMETSITSEQALVEDEVVAYVTRDCVVDDRIVIPAGAEARGEVTLVERGGRLRDRAQLGVRFTSIVLTNGTRIPLETETIYREGDALDAESAAKIGGGAIGGAIIGGIFGGTRGATMGGSIGAGTGTAAVLSGGHSPAARSRGTALTIRITAPTIVAVVKE